MPSPQSHVDLSRYPIHDLEAAADLIATCRAQLSESGVMTLPGFLTPAAVKLMTDEAQSVADDAYWSTVEGNAYLEPTDESLPVDHPRRMTESTRLGALAYDQIPGTHALRQLYEWDGLLRFLGRALGREPLYRYADTMGALNVAVMRDGDYLRWHFDQTDFVVSLALQEATEGGDFEYVPYVRRPGDECYPAVREVLQGKSGAVRRLPVTPGTLILFEGRYSIHRVTTIRGDRQRLMALLGYDTKPGVVSSDHLRYMRYGRT